MSAMDRAWAWAVLTDGEHDYIVYPNWQDAARAASERGVEPIPLVPVTLREIPPDERKSVDGMVLERAAWMLNCYVDFVRSVGSADLERHPYLPEMEEMADKLKAAAHPNAQEVVSRNETCKTCGAWKDEDCPRRPCEYVPHVPAAPKDGAEPINPVQDAETMTSTPKAKATNESEQWAHIPRRGPDKDGADELLRIFVRPAMRSYMQAIQDQRTMHDLKGDLQMAERHAKQMMEDALFEIDAYLVRASTDMVMVPKEPTEEMIRAAMEYQRSEGKGWSFSGTYKAMLAAASGPVE